MMTPSKTPSNEQKLRRLQTVLAEILAEVLRRGYYGTAAVEVNVADGTIQHIRLKTERIER
jgi:hypothetical protein